MSDGGMHKLYHLKLKKRCWLLIPVLMLIYVLLGISGFVPWFEMTSCQAHVAKAKRALTVGEYAEATRHIIAAMRQLDRYPAYDRQCWELICGDITKMVQTKEKYPSTVELNKMLHSGDPVKVVKAFTMQVKRRQLARSIRVLEAAVDIEISEEEHKKNNLHRYLQHMQLLLNTYQTMGQNSVFQSLMLRRHKQIVSQLPPGRELILESFFQIDSLEALSPKEKMRLYETEMQRCELAKPCPEIALLVLGSHSLRYADTTQQLTIASRNIELMMQFLHKPSLNLLNFIPSSYLGSTVSLLLKKGKKEVLQKQLDSIIMAACSTYSDKREFAVEILYSCADCFSIDNEDNSGYVPDHQFYIRNLQKIIAALERVDSRSFSTAMAWGILGDTFLDQHNYVKAEKNYNKSIAVLNRACGCNVTRMMLNKQEPGDGQYYYEIWHIYSGYCTLLQKTGRKKLAELILPMLHQTYS